MTRPISTFFVVAVVGLPQAATAQLWDNGRDALGSPTAIDQNREVADDFILGTTSSISGFWFRGADLGGYSGSIYWRVLDDSGGRPGTEVAGGEWIGSGVNFVDFYYDFSLSVGSLTLGPGHYWLALQDRSAPAGSFGWDRTLGGAQNAVYQDQNDGLWLGTGSEYAFRVEGTSVSVPEPGTYLLMLTGVLGLAIVAVRRREDEMA